MGEDWSVDQYINWGASLPDMTAVGPQTDGTVMPAANAVVVKPADAGGGLPANYAPQVLDIFKYGLGIWNQQTQQQNLLDYKRFEATQWGAVMQGQPALTVGANGRPVGSASGVMLIIGIVLVVMLAKDK